MKVAVVGLPHTAAAIACEARKLRTIAASDESIERKLALMDLTVNRVNIMMEENRLFWLAQLGRAVTG